MSMNPWNVLIGLLMFVLGVWGFLQPDRVFAQLHMVLSDRTDRWRGRAWNWWAKRGFPIFVLAVPGAALVVSEVLDLS